jgi:hypothetical protein
VRFWKPRIAQRLRAAKIEKKIAKMKAQSADKPQSTCLLTAPENISFQRWP